MPFESSFNEQTRLGLPAGAAVVFIMRTNEDVVQREDFAQAIVHAIQLTPILVSARQPRLIGGGDKDESRRFQLFQPGNGALAYVKFLKRERANLLQLFSFSRIQDTISLDKYSLLHAFVQQHKPRRNHFWP